jgi:DNA-binding response OmpR family regulator
VDGWLAMLVAGELGRDDEPLLDTVGRHLRLGEQRIPLTELELALIAYLSEHEGQAVSRSRLRQDVWGDTWQGGSNVVDVAVSGLRRKLGDHAGMIETVRGVGYRLSFEERAGERFARPAG